MHPAATLAAALAWAPLPAATLERTEVASARIGNSIYVVGGFVPGGASTSAVERYDIRRRRWSRMRAMPLALNHTTASAHRGRLYVQGGYEGPLSQPTARAPSLQPGHEPLAATARRAHPACSAGGGVRGRPAIRGGRGERLRLAAIAGDLQPRPEALEQRTELLRAGAQPHDRRGVRRPLLRAGRARFHRTSPPRSAMTRAGGAGRGWLT